MNPAYTYLTVDACCILVPFLASFHPKIAFNKQWRFFSLPCLFTAILFLAWDHYFTRIGVWSFNPHYVTGVYLLNLPIEEILFFICIPYSCVFTYFVFRTYLKPIEKSSKYYSIALFISIASIVVAIIFHNKFYTFSTFTLLSIGLAVSYINRASWLPLFMVSYVVLLLPFMISNGILTGSLINAPVVLYNNTQNLGIRLGTIPIEDVFYGMLLFLMNVSGFEYLKKKQKNNNYLFK